MKKVLDIFNDSKQNAGWNIRKPRVKTDYLKKLVSLYPNLI